MGESGKPSGRARILIVTGPGKGKTTAALGIVLRGLATGGKVLLARFTKAAHSGELDILGSLPGMTILSSSRGMTPPAGHPDYPRHVAAARDLFERTRAAAPDHRFIVLDEICGVVARGMLAEDEVAAFLAGLRGDQTAVLTGRGAGPGLIAIADTVSEILCLKHGYARGIEAQRGVEM